MSRIRNMATWKHFAAAAEQLFGELASCSGAEAEHLVSRGSVPAMIAI